MDKKLNKEQLKAVKHKKGPLLIIAGAGTGKTTVITERIKHIIEKELAKTDEILALTFTDKAAREMEERVDMALPYGYTQMWISTFHSFCDQILRSDAFHIGLNSRYKLMTQAQTIQLIRNNLFNFKLKYFRPLGNPTKFVGGMLQHFSRLQDEDVSPEEYLKWVKGQKKSYSAKASQDDSADSRILSAESKSSKEEELELEKWTELANAYKAYDELKVKEGLFDYGDLIVKTLELFRNRPNILKKYKDQFKYILVDEFQDTNIAQNDLVMMLAGKNGNITVVADDDQSIYKWRGAAVSNVLQFRENYPKAKLITLTKNYRSGQKILDGSYKLIQHNNPDRLEQVENIDKKLESQVSPASRKASRDDSITFIHSDRVENEADAVAKEVKRLIEEEDFNWSDIAVLVRANNHADSFIRSFQRRGVPYQFLGPGRLFKQLEVIDMISYLKVLYNFEDDVSLYRLLSIEELGVDHKDLSRVANYARKYNLSIYDAIKKSKDIFIKGGTRKKLKKIIKIIDKHLKFVRKESAGQLLYDFLEESELLVELLNPDTAVAQKRAKNISKFFDKLKTYEVDNEDATVMSVVDWIDLSMDLGESPLAADIDWSEINAVNILTVHSAKGLEFPVVFLVNLVGERFPSRRRSEQIPIPDELIKESLPSGDHHLQEERRLFYVAMTRAKEKLFFTAANYYGEGKREKKLSPFIFEALGDKVIQSESSFAKATEDRQLSFLDYKPSNIDPSTMVKSEVQDLHIDYLSYSQIDVFRVCPLHYKLKYIFNVPTPPTSALSFGMTMHATMKDFYEAAVAGEKATVDTLLKTYEKNWRREGYVSRAYEKKMHTRGIKYLKGFYKESFDKKNLPKALELPFVVPLKSPSKNARPLKIGGKMDRVDVLSDGTVEIVDYKTGEKVPTQKQADNDLQLTFYALAASKLTGEIFDVDLKKLKMSFYYFEEQVKVTTQRTQKQLDQTEKEIFEWREKIETSDFKCSKHMFCDNCEYKLFCAADE
ncbi:UvrD-helicase domain-containing protein [Candidatus Woesebacteria bacterium]|nr:UvrD-helicase domain-containing protein [Candidatus Woesebacteria bacterium]